MHGSRGMTLVEVLIGCAVLSVVLMTFASGMFMAMRLMNAAEDKKMMERSAEKYILAGEANLLGVDDINVYELIENERYHDRAIIEPEWGYTVGIEVDSPLSGGTITSGVSGTRITASIEYGQGFNQNEAEDTFAGIELSCFLFEGLD